ncbi:MAG: ethanolamine ammonia-lyase reactivating factor EutA, partial [Terriglobales bacterium]
LTADGIVDASAVAAIVRCAYEKAAVTVDQILAGAVIITGETARLRNAEQVTHELASLAGEFVVASAGPHLESLLAAQGSGAIEYSRKTGLTVLNLDIGGGTVNAAVVHAGRVIDTACLAVGGRFVKLSANGTIVAITELGRRLLDTSLSLQRFAPGTVVNRHDLWQLGTIAAQRIVQFVSGQESGLETLMLTEPLPFAPPADQIWITGGVGRLIALTDQEEFSYAGLERLIPYGDVGLPLAVVLQRLLDQGGYKVHIPECAIRATVIGAGMHALQLSGSTIEHVDIKLPLKNVPLVRLNPYENEDAPGQMRSYTTIADDLKDSLKRNDLDWHESA